MRALTVRGWGTLGALGVLIGVMIATLALAPREAARPPAPTVGIVQTAALARCHDLGPAAESDADCHAAWHALSQHFFGTDRQGGRP